MTLFKYLHPDRSDVLRTRSIRFSQIHVLNDPFEMKPHISAIANNDYILAQAEKIIPQVLAEELAKLPPQLQQLVPQEVLAPLFIKQASELAGTIATISGSFMPAIRETFDRKFSELLGILCLTELPDNLAMWAHYADSHRGFVIGFDEASPFFDRRNSASDDLRHLRRVVYSEERPSVTLVDVGGFEPFLTKGTDWSYEREWRMVQTLDAASSVVGSGYDAVHLFTFPPEALQTIIMGCRMSAEKQAEIRQLLQVTPAFSHVRCVQAELDERHYRVRFA